MKVFVALALLAGVSGAQPAAPPSAPSTPPTPDVPDRNMSSHFIGVRGNIGTSYELGLGYIHAHETWGKGGYFWWGYGPDVRLTLDSSGVAGVTPLVIGRTAVVTHGLPTGFELGLGAALGVGDNSETTFVAVFGAFLTLYYADFGYQYQLAIDRPDWMGAHFFAIRGHVPVFRR